MCNFLDITILLLSLEDAGALGLLRDLGALHATRYVLHSPRTCLFKRRLRVHRIPIERAACYSSLLALRSTFPHPNAMLQNPSYRPFFWVSRPLRSLYQLLLPHLSTWDFAKKIAIYFKVRSASDGGHAKRLFLNIWKFRLWNS